MNKEQMLMLQNKITHLEKMLMRDLNDQEVEYLNDHSVEEFFENRLGYDAEDITVLNKIRGIISKWCTQSCWRPSEEALTNDEDFFTETNASGKESEKINDSLDFFDQTKYLDQKVKDTLKTILSNLENKSSSIFVVNRGVVPLISVSPTFEKSAQTDFNLEEPKADTDCPEEELVNPKITQFNWEDYFPSNARKWLEFATFDEFKYQLDKRIKFPCALTAFDAAVGDILDYFKDLHIKSLIIMLEYNKYLTINDKEIKSEVIDYLFRNNYKIKITNNKIELL